jgi:hypothetical protein
MFLRPLALENGTGYELLKSRVQNDSFRIYNTLVTPIVYVLFVFAANTFTKELSCCGTHLFLTGRH